MILLPVQKKIYYSQIRFGTTLLMNMIDLSLFWFYWNNMDLKAEYSGIAVGMGKVVLAFAAFFFGYISDNLPSTIKVGRRKLFMWIGSPLMAISFFFLFTPWLFYTSPSQITLFVWLIAWNTLFNLFYGVTVAPYQSWMPEITTAQDRVTVSAFQNIANFLGSAVSIAFVFFLLGFIEQTGGFTPQASKILLVAIILFGIIEFVLFLPSLLFIEEKFTQVLSPRPLKGEFAIILANKDYKGWLATESISGLGITLISALILDFIEKELHLDTVQETLSFGAVLFFSTLIGMIVWTNILKIVGNRLTLLISLGWLSISLLSTFLLDAIAIYGLTNSLIFGSLVGFGIGAYSLMSYVIVADLIEADTNKTNISRAGIYTGFRSIPFNLTQSLSYIIAGFIVHYLYILPIIPICFFVICLPFILNSNFDPVRPISIKMRT